MTDAYVEFLDPLAARGLRGVVWLGAWSNDTCSWEFDDATVRSLVTPIAGHPAILAYYLGDEPYYSWCPGGPAAYAARTALVHSLDPGRPTFTVIASYDPGNNESYPYGHWLGAVDILGLDIYPCNFVAQPCDFAIIDEAIAAAASAGIPAYWAVIQDFQDAYYRLPTPQELATEFDRWNTSRMAGYFVFSWNYGAVQLDTQSSNVSMLAQENALHGWSR